MQVPRGGIFIVQHSVYHGLRQKNGKNGGDIEHGQITLLDPEMHPGKQQTLQVFLRHLPIL